MSYIRIAFIDNSKRKTTQKPLNCVESELSPSKTQNTTLRKQLKIGVESELPSSKTQKTTLHKYLKIYDISKLRSSTTQTTHYTHLKISVVWELRAWKTQDYVNIGVESELRL